MGQSFQPTQQDTGPAADWSPDQETTSGAPSSSNAVSRAGGAYGNDAAQAALADQGDQEELPRLTGQAWSVQDFVPSTGSGCFDLAWFPLDGVVVVTCLVAFDFRDSHPAGAEWIASGGGDHPLEAYQWQEGEADAWKADAIAQIESIWASGGHLVHGELPALPAARIVVNVEEVPPSEAHFVMVVKKLPEDRSGHSGFRDEVDHETGQVALYEASQDEGGMGIVDRPTHALAAPHLGAHAEIGELLRDPVFFGHASDVPAAADAQRLDRVAALLGRDGTPSFPMDLWGYAGPEEGDSQAQNELSARRVAAVRGALGAEGAALAFTTHLVGSQEGDTGSQARRVEVFPQQVSVSQATVVHESGHMLGLPDEYVDEGPDAPSYRPEADTELGYPDRAAQLDGHVTVAGDTPSVMSQGEQILPRHYVTIVEALEAATDTAGQWTVRS